MTFEEFVAQVRDWRTRLAPAHAARAIERLSQTGVVELPQGEVLEIALLLAIVLAAKKEPGRPRTKTRTTPPITEEQPVTIVKCESTAVLPRDTPPSEHDPTGSRWITDRRARDFLQYRLKDGPKLGAELEAAAKAVAIPESDLIRAADALGVVTRPGEWRWPGATKAAAEGTQSP
jgi:hypothetical protein